MIKRQQKKMAALVGKWSNANIISSLQAASIGGIISNSMAKKSHISLETMARRRFGSFSQACIAAGILNASDVKKKYTKCSVKECNKKNRSSGIAYCEVHYYRIRRNGNTDRKAPAYKGIASNGYIWIKDDNHFLSKANGMLYEHRAVYYDACGDGNLYCHWCKIEVKWDNLHIDHLNNIKTDNRIDNLVTSCPKCNMARGQDKMKKTMRAKGRQFTYNGMTMCLSEWSAYLGISRAAIGYRIDVAKWPISKALSQPRGKTGVKRQSC